MSVAPRAQFGAPTVGEVLNFRDDALESPVWNTRPGSALLQWFWQSKIGVWWIEKFNDAEPPELHGYAYWGPVALVITVVEILGALKKSSWAGVPWPTISGTVGHIENIDSRWGLFVVFVIALAAGYAVSYSGEAAETGRTPLFRIGPLKVRYGWPLVFVITGTVAAVVRILTRNEFHLGYAIWGTFAVVGILIPTILVRVDSSRVVFPSLFYTFSKLRGRFRWLALVVTGGLTILILHLALYPWPNLDREPAKYAGLNAYHAESQALAALKASPNVLPNLVYSTQARGVSQGQSTWFVYFDTVSGGKNHFSGCVVEVTDTTTVIRKACKTPAP